MKARLDTIVALTVCCLIWAMVAALALTGHISPWGVTICGCGLAYLMTP